VTGELDRLLESLEGVVTSRELAGAGLGHTAITATVRGGRLRRIAQGLYADTSAWEGAPPWERYRMRVRAMLRVHPAWVASHHAALTLHGLPLHGVDLDVVDVAATVRTSSRRPGVHVHRLQPHHVPLLEFRPRALPPALACVLVAAASGVEAGVVSMDAALHREACTPKDLEAALAHPGTRYGRPSARAAVARADGLSESPGESRTRLLLSTLGVEVRSQVDIRDATGFIGRVDFLVAGRVVVEFDGAVKYAGADGQEALLREKRREERLRDAGYRVVRITWDELSRPAALLARITAAVALAA
jgi:very-short-patch-repair endonuclease